MNDKYFEDERTQSRRMGSVRVDCNCSFIHVKTSSGAGNRINYPVKSLLFEEILADNSAYLTVMNGKYLVELDVKFNLPKVIDIYIIINNIERRCRLFLKLSPIYLFLISNYFL